MNIPTLAHLFFLGGGLEIQNILINMHGMEWNRTENSGRTPMFCTFRSLSLSLSMPKENIMMVVVFTQSYVHVHL